jgi:hypothetical protein
MRNPLIAVRLAPMRPSRLVIVGLTGLLALHIFMLAGHGRGHDTAAGMPGTVQHGASATSSCCPISTAAAAGRAGNDMTVACLAEMAGLLILRPRSRYQTATPGPDQQAPTRHPTRGDPAGLRTRSLEELCISLT